MQHWAGSAAALAVAEAIYSVRRRGLYGLGYVGGDAEALLRGPAGLGDPDFRLRAVAVRSLGVSGGPDALHAVADALGDRQAEVRWTAAAILGRSAPPGVAPLLIDRLSDTVAEVRRQAALALGHLKAEDARQFLVELAEKDINIGVRTAAATSLKLLQDR